MQKETTQTIENSVADGQTDWVALAAMTDEEVLAAALSDPDAQPSPEGSKMHPMALAKRLRFNLVLSQEDFADRYHIPLATLKAWERHELETDPVALAFLHTIAIDPEGVARALRQPYRPAQAAE
jgi:putative transcriptional regulator